jgi:hypothetical protein
MSAHSFATFLHDFPSWSPKLTPPGLQRHILRRLEGWSATSGVPPAQANLRMGESKSARYARKFNVHSGNSGKYAPMIIKVSGVSGTGHTAILDLAFVRGSWCWPLSTPRNHEWPLLIPEVVPFRSKGSSSPEHSKKSPGRQGVRAGAKSCVDTGEKKSQPGAECRRNRTYARCSGSVATALSFPAAV